MKFSNNSFDDHVQQTSKQCSYNSNFRLRISVSSHQGGRKYMEDEYAIVQYQSPPHSPNENNSQVMQQSFAFFGIFDGHGGDMAAQYTRQNLCKNIVRQKYFWSNDDDKICLAIHRGFITTQKEMMKEVGNWPKTNLGLPSTSGTTASVLFIMNGKYYTGHVGDSRIVLGKKFKCSDRWRTFPMTRDHKPESPREKNRIEAAGGQVMNKSGIGRVVWNRPRRPNFDEDDTEPIAYDLIPFLSVARSLGDLWSLNKCSNQFIVSPEPDVKCIPIDSTDKCLILASDGLWNMISMKQAVQIIQDFEEEEEEELNEDDECYDDDPEELSPGVVIEPNQSHSQKLLKVCLDRWMNTRFRADNTTVLVVMLDQIQNNYNHLNLQHKRNQMILSCFDFDRNENNDRYHIHMIGDTIHTFDCFDKKQIDEDFLDVFKTKEEIEIETILNEMLNKFCQMCSDENNETTVEHDEIELFIDDEKLSLINFSTLSSHHHHQLRQQQASFLNNYSSTTTMMPLPRFNNFNYSFSIVDHKYSNLSKSNNNGHLAVGCSDQTLSTQTMELTTESNMISHNWASIEADHFSYKNYDDENFTEYVPTNSNCKKWFQLQNDSNHVNNQPVTRSPSSPRNFHSTIDHRHDNYLQTPEQCATGNHSNYNISDNHNQDEQQLNNQFDNVINTNKNESRLPEKNGMFDEKGKVQSSESNMKRKYEQLIAVTDVCCKRRCFKNDELFDEKNSKHHPRQYDDSPTEEKSTITEVKHGIIDDRSRDYKSKIHSINDDNQPHCLSLKQYKSTPNIYCKPPSHHHHINELTDHSAVLATKE